MRVTVTCWRVLTDLTQSPLSTSARRALHCNPCREGGVGMPGVLRDLPPPDPLSSAHRVFKAAAGAPQHAEDASFLFSVVRDTLHMERWPVRLSTGDVEQPRYVRRTHTHRDREKEGTVR